MALRDEPNIEIEDSGSDSYEMTEDDEQYEEYLAAEHALYLGEDPFADTIYEAREP